MSISTNEFKDWKYLYLGRLGIIVIGIDLLTTSIPEMVVSDIYAKECSIQPKVSLFLLTLEFVNLFDTVPLITTLYFSSRRVTDDAERRGLTNKISLNLHILITLFHLIWVITGSVWVFSI